jgi:HicB family
MSTMTIRIPEDRHERLRQLAKYRGISVNKLVEEFSTIGLAQFDAELRFRSLAARGSPKRALAIIDKVDAAFGRR